MPEVAQLATRWWGSEGRGAVHRPLAVLVHGVTSSSRTWWRVGPALVERGFRVLAVDLRGHGSSPRPTAGQSVADLATDVAETVEAAAGSPVPAGRALAGCPGGAQLVAAQPGFARRLVVEDPPGASSIDWAAIAAGIEADTRRAASEPDALRRELEAANPAWPAGEAERRVADLADCDGQAVAAAMRPGVPLDLPALLAAPIPVLLLLGEESLGSTLLGLDRKAAVEALSDGTARVLPAGGLHRGPRPLAGALDAWLVPWAGAAGAEVATRGRGRPMWPELVAGVGGWGGVGAGCAAEAGGWGGLGDAVDVDEGVRGPGGGVGGGFEEERTGATRVGAFRRAHRSSRSWWGPAARRSQEASRPMQSWAGRSYGGPTRSGSARTGARAPTARWRASAVS